VNHSILLSSYYLKLYNIYVFSSIDEFYRKSLKTSCKGLNGKLRYLASSNITSDTTTTPKLPLEALQKEIIKMQNEVVGRARWTQSVILGMTLTAFCISVFLVLVAVAQVLLEGNLVFGAISSGGGIGTLLVTLLYNPIEKAQKSVGDLVQVQIVFLSFNSKVTIWLQDVKAKIESEVGLQDQRVKEATQDIEEAAANALDHIQYYCKGHKISNQSNDP